MKRKLIIYIVIALVITIGTITTITLLDEEELPRELTKEIGEILQENNDWICDATCYIETEKYIISKTLGSNSDFHLRVKTDEDIIQIFYYDYFHNELLLMRPSSTPEDPYIDCSVSLFNRVTCLEYSRDIPWTSQRLIHKMIDYIDSILEDYKVNK